MRLDIGCGADLQDGFTGIDAYVVGPGIVNAPMWALPFGDGSVELIHSSHALEHIPKRAVTVTLTEWLRVLQPGGGVQIVVPDLAWCCREWLTRLTNDWYMDIIFGNQDHEGEFHQTGFTAAILRNYLVDAGFEHVTVSTIWTHRQQSLEAIARKPA